MERCTRDGQKKSSLVRNLIEAEHLVKHLHLSRQTEYDANSLLLMRSIDSPDKDNLQRSSTRPAALNDVVSINERLYMDFTETCPLFLLKEGIDHRFEFLDFAPDLYIRQRFRPMNQDDSLSSSNESQMEPLGNTRASGTYLFSNNNQQEKNRTTEIE